MFHTFDGLPVHPLVVHGVVVLLRLGESLEKKVDDPGEHAVLGDQLLVFARSS